MTEVDWLKRYEAAFIKAGVPPAMAAQCTQALPFAELSEDYEDDPEGAADMEMSYWDGD